MANFQQDTVVEDIRSRCDIVELIGSYIPLKRAGTNTYKGLCPFHQEKTPSFHVDSARQMFHCFGCGKGGDVFSFLMEKENIGFNDAKHMLAARVGVIIPEYRQDDRSPEDGRKRAGARERLYQINEAYCRFFQENLFKNPESTARKYLEKRQIPMEIAQQFRIGYAPDDWTACLEYGRKLGFPDEELVTSGVIRRKEETGRCFDHFKGRLTFAIENEQGRVVGFSARSLEANPMGGKYINTPETPVFKKGNLLYALPSARKTMTEKNMAILCEGQLDSIAFHRAGVTCAVAPQGTGFTEGQARILKRYTNRIFLAFDADSAGQKAILRAVELLLPLSMEVRVIRIPGGKDPDELFRNGGAEAVQAAVNAAVPWLDMLCDSLKQRYDFQSPVGRGAAVTELIGYFNMVVNRIELDAYVQNAAAVLNVSEDSIFAEMRSERRQNSRKLSYQAESKREIFAGSGNSAPNAASPGNAIPEPKLSAAERTLLELAIGSEPIARQMAEWITPEDLKNGAFPFQVLNRIINLALNGEHARVGAAVSDMLREHPSTQISALLVGEHCFADPEKALSDTISTFRRDRAEQRKAELLAALRGNPPVERQLEILKEIDQLKGDLTL